jgi:OOP family OmpA-OmpF porin
MLKNKQLQKLPGGNMAKHLFRMFLWTVGLMLAGCAAQKPVTPFAPIDLNPKIQSGQYIQNANNLMIILDNSGSMKDFYLGQRKFGMAADIVNRINWTIPDIKLNIALRTFGFDIISSEETTLVYGPIPYYAYGFEEAFKEVKRPNGPGQMDLAIDASMEDLSSTAVLGKIAMVIISDGKEMSIAPLVSTERLKAIYGDRICIYTIQIGNDSAGRMLLEKIAKAGGCGFSSQGEQILSSSDMADFVERVLLMKKPGEPGSKVINK